MWARLPTGPDDEFWWASPIYWVSTLGRVYWFAPEAPPRLREGFKALRPVRGGGSARKRPRLATNLHVAKGGQGADRRVYVHRLVLATHASPSSGLAPLGRHGPGGSLDNRLGNLTRGTYRENLLDAYRQGERLPGNQYTAREEPPELAYAGPSDGCPF